MKLYQTCLQDIDARKISPRIGFRLNLKIRI